MQSAIRFLLRWGACGALAVALAMMLPGVLSAFAANQTATLPASSCTLTGATRTCELWAKTGTLSLPDGTSVTIWGYSDSATGNAQLPGPALIVNQGETVNVILHNTLSQASGLDLQAQGMRSDMTGVPAGGTGTYTFSASQPGTYLYQAGLTPNGARQTAMGLYGALIVRPTGQPLQAYDASNTFDDEALVVLSEIDPKLNANPTGFSLQNYAPKYLLINGKVFPATTAISTGAGHKLLLRYVNAGIEHHALGLLGLRQRIIATDGSPLQYPSTVVAETLAAGQTLDTLVSIPANAPASAKYALYNSGMPSVGYGSANTIGGMLTFITTATGTGGGSDTSGPTTSGVTLSPATSTGTSPVAISASVSDAANGNSNVTAAEFFIDTPGANGSGTAMTGSFTSPTVSVNGTISVATLAGLSSGSHTIYVHGKDAANNWGTVSSAVLNLSKSGPTVSAVSLTPNPTNAGPIAIQATASGSANITAAEFFFNTTPGANGSGTALTLNQNATTVALTGSIPAGALTSLADGSYNVQIHARDALNVWGAFTTVQLKLDKTGPASSTVAVTPNPSNGQVSASQTMSALKITASFSDPLTGGVNANLKGAEAFLDTPGANGSGLQFVANDGLFNSTSESGYAYLPLSALQTIADGTHIVRVHAQDAAGNWGAFAQVNLVLDRTGPTVANGAGTPNPTVGAANITLTATATDATTSVAGGEWFEGADPGVGKAAAMNASDGTFNSATEGLTASIPTSGLALGSHTFKLRAKDVLANWGATISVVVIVSLPDAIFADGFESGNFNAWNGGATGGNRISVTTAAKQAGTYGMQASATSYVTDNSPVNESSYRARFYFNPNSSSGSSQDIFVGRTSGGTTMLRVQFQRTGSGTTNNPYVYQIRAGALQGGGTTYTNWYNISGTTSQAIEISWASGNNASFSLSIGGSLKQTLNNLNTNNYKLEQVRLGPSSSGSGTQYYDSFVSRRYTSIGP